MESDKGGFWPEEVHLARALFRRGAIDLQQVGFQEGFVNPPGAAGTDSPIGAGVDEPLYQPLQGEKSFRLLALKAGRDQDGIQCVLVTVEIAQCPTYEAISYVWGDSADRLSILCDQKEIHITRNLHDVLHRLRSADSIRYLWADAICINQEDAVELGLQVSIMESIYGNAKQVLVWLGQDSQEEAQQALGLISTIIDHWQIPSVGEIQDGFAEYNNKITAATKGEYDDLPPMSATSWHSLGVLYSLPWFERVWVIQEVTTATSVTVLWGNAHISWSLIGLASAWIMTKGYDMIRKHPIQGAYNAFLMYALPIAGNSAFKELPFSVVTELVHGRFQSTDPRDRIFAMLGQMHAGQNLTLLPDYTRSVKSVYVDTTQRILRQDRHLRILSAVQHKEQIDLDWPSWVPKWHEPGIEPLGFRDENSYYANAGELFDVEDGTFGEGSLAVKGIVYDQVTEVSDVMHEGQLGYQALGAFTPEWYQLLGALASAEEDYRTTWNAGKEKFMLARDDSGRETITMNYVQRPGRYSQREQIEPPKGHLSEFFLYWKERSSWADTFESDDKALMEWYRLRTKDTEDSERCLGALYSCHGRRVLVTKDGEYGLGPAIMEPGDYICVLYGAIVPFILRRRKDHWQLIGECFLPGIMKGECVETTRKTECHRHDATFILK